MKYEPSARIKALDAECIQKFGISALKVAEIADKHKLSLTLTAKFLHVAPNTLRNHLKGLGKGDLFPPQYGRPSCDPRRMAIQEERGSAFREEVLRLYEAKKRADGAVLNK